MIELMVAGAVASIALLAATQAYLQLIRIQRDLRRKNDVSIQLALGQVLLERNLANAGLNFADPRYAFRVRNNVAADMANGDGTTIAAVTGGGTAAGVVIGTDAIEIMYGEPTNRRPGVVVGCPTGGCNTGGGNGAVNLATAEPFTPTEAVALTTSSTMTGPVVLFTNDVGVSCLVRAVSLTSNLNTTVNFKFLDTDMAVTSTPPANCPAAGMNAYGADVRQRFLVYQGANAANPGIYVQTQGAGTTVLGAPQLLLAGVEDVQVAPLVINAGTGALQPCNDLVGTPTCVYPNNNETNLRGARLNLTVQGVETLPQAGALRPVSFDHNTSTTTGVGVYRALGTAMVFLPNAAPLAL
jgi:Tfp pilus assembly protein PilE